MSPCVQPPAGALAPLSSRRHRHPSPTSPMSMHPSRWFFPSYQQTPRRPAFGARSGSQRGPVVAQASGPPFSTVRSSGRTSSATTRSHASTWSLSSLPPQCRHMVHRHAPRSCPNHLAATTTSVYLHTTDQEPAQSPQSRDYTQLVHSMCWQSLITPRSRPQLPLSSVLRIVRHWSMDGPQVCQQGTSRRSARGPRTVRETLEAPVSIGYTDGLKRNIWALADGPPMDREWSTRAKSVGSP
jgi:hypothetical protein